MAAKARIDSQTTEVAALLHERLSRLSRQLRHMDLPIGMTPERLSTLALIDRSGPISVTALADQEMVRPATMSRMVSALVDEGMAKRRSDKTDGRGVLVTITAKGRRTYQKAQQQRLEQFSAALGGLEKDKLAALKGVAESLEELATVLNETPTEAE